MKILLGVFVFLFLVIAFVGYKVSLIPNKPVHYHANFAVIEDGKLADFSKPEFMHISPCTDTDVHSDNPKDNVHLHEGIGNVVHVHADGITWKTFFETIGYWEKITQDQEMAQRAENFTFDIRVNGESVNDDVLTKPIIDREQLLIVTGSMSADLKKDADAVGNNAKDYDDGKVGIEKCGATGDRSFLQRFKIAFGL
ncbi:MAG: hypothetical protein ABI758_05880 [Candidatus Woesebacteria bacterium]